MKKDNRPRKRKRRLGEKGDLGKMGPGE